MAFDWHTSLRGKIAIAQHEGIVTRRYLDSVGVWTIGVGVTAEAGASINPDVYTGEITVRHAIDLMIAVLPQYEAIARRLCDGYLPAQHEFDALVSLAYNVGGYKLRPSNTRNTRALIAAGRADRAINLWRKNEDRGRKLRRDDEVFLAKTGIYPKKDIPIYRHVRRDGTPVQTSWMRASELEAMLTPQVPFEHIGAGSPQTGWVGV